MTTPGETTTRKNCYDGRFELGPSMDPEEVFLTDGLAADLA